MRDRPALAFGGPGLTGLAAADPGRWRSDDEFLVLAPRQQRADCGQVAVVRRWRCVPIAAPQVRFELSSGDLGDIGVAAEFIDEAFERSLIHPAGAGTEL